MKIIWTPRAKERFFAIIDFIAEDNPAVAENWGGRMVKKAEKLAEFPKQGRMVPELRRSDIRELLEGDYRMIYRCGEKEIFILTVRHARRNLTRKDIM